MQEMQDETIRTRKEIENWTQKYEALKRFAIENKIPIPPELDNM